MQSKPGGHKALDSFCSTTKIEEQKVKGADNLYQFRSYTEFIKPYYVC